MIKKIVSLFTLTCFLFCGIGGETLQAVVLSNAAAAPAATHFEDTVIPSGAGRITGGEDFGGKPLVIAIQDLHCHPEVQRNIAKILSALDAKYGLGAVYVEGGYGQVDTSWLSDIEDEAIRNKIVEGLVNRGLMTGAEYYSVTARRPQLLKGLEDEKLHKENIVRLGKIVEKKEYFEHSLRVLDKDMAFMGAKFFGPKNRKFNRLVIQHREGKMTGEKYYTLLGKYVDAVNNDPGRYNTLFSIRMDDFPNIKSYIALSRAGRRLDYRKAAREMQAFLRDLKTIVPYSVYAGLLKKTDNFANLDELYLYLSSLAREYRFDITARYPDLARFLAYAERSRTLNPVQMIYEEKKLVAELRMGFSRNTAELEVAFLADFYPLFADYLLNRLSADDYDYFRQRFDKFRSVWAKYAFKDRIAGLSGEFPLLDEFYAVNCERNRCFLDRAGNFPARPAAERGQAADLMAQPQTAINGFLKRSEICVMVTGGFHTEGLRSLLAERGISYLTVTPNVTQDTALSSVVYMKLAREQAKILSNAIQVGLLAQTSLKEKFRLALEGITPDEIPAALEALTGKTGIRAKYENGIVTLDNGARFSVEETEPGKVVVSRASPLTVLSVAVKAALEGLVQFEKLAAAVTRIYETGNADELIILATKVAAEYDLIAGNGLASSILNDPALKDLDLIRDIQPELLARFPIEIQDAIAAYQKKTFALDTAPQREKWLQILLSVDLLRDFVSRVPRKTRNDSSDGSSPVRSSLSSKYTERVFQGVSPLRRKLVIAPLVEAFFLVPVALLHVLLPPVGKRLEEWFVLKAHDNADDEEIEVRREGVQRIVGASWVSMALGLAFTVAMVTAGVPIPGYFAAHSGVPAFYIVIALLGFSSGNVLAHSHHNLLNEKGYLSIDSFIGLRKAAKKIIERSRKRGDKVLQNEVLIPGTEQMQNVPPVFLNEDMLSQHQSRPETPSASGRLIPAENEDTQEKSQPNDAGEGPIQETVAADKRKAGTVPPDPASIGGRTREQQSVQITGNSPVNGTKGGARSEEKHQSLKSGAIRSDREPLISRIDIRHLNEVSAYLAEHDVPEGSTLYIDFDDTMAYTEGIATSQFIAQRYRMMRNGVQHNSDAYRATHNDRDFQSWKRNAKWMLPAAVTEYIAMEEKEIARSMVHPVEGVLPLLKLAKNKKMRIVIATNRAQSMKENMLAVLESFGLSFDEQEILIAGHGDRAKAEAIVKDMNVRAPPVAYFIDDNARNVDALQHAGIPRGMSVHLFHFYHPVPRTSLSPVRDLQETIKNAGVMDTADWETLLARTVIAIAQLRDDKGNPDKALQLRMLDEVLDIIEMHGLNTRDFVFSTGIYQYLYETLEYIINSRSLFNAPPRFIPLPLKLYFRIVFPFNYATAMDFYEKGKLSLSDVPKSDVHRYKNGAEAMLMINEQNMFLFLEPILKGILADPPDLIILPDTGARPYYGILRSFIKRQGLQTKILLLPSSFHDVGDTPEEILGRLSLGEQYLKSGGSLIALQMFLKRNGLFPDLQGDKNAGKLEEVGSFYASFFPITSSEKILLFDDNVGSGRTFTALRGIFAHFGANSENFRVATPLLMGGRIAQDVKYATAFYPGSTSWGLWIPKIMVYPVWESKFGLRMVERRKKGEHLITETRANARSRATAEKFRAVSEANFATDWETYADTIGTRKASSATKNPTENDIPRNYSDGDDSLSLAVTLSSRFVERWFRWAPKPVRRLLVAPVLEASVLVPVALARVLWPSVGKRWTDWFVLKKHDNADKKEITTRMGGVRTITQASWKAMAAAVIVSALMFTFGIPFPVFIPAYLGVPGTAAFYFRMALAGFIAGNIASHSLFNALHEKGALVIRYIEDALLQDRTFVSLKRAAERINPDYDQAALREAYVRHRKDMNDRSREYGGSDATAEEYLEHEYHSGVIEENPREEKRSRHMEKIEDLPYLRELRDRYGISAWETEETEFYDGKLVEKTRKLVAPEYSLVFIRFLTLMGREKTADILFPKANSGEAGHVDAVFDSISRTAAKINPNYDRAALAKAYKKYRLQLEDSVLSDGKERVEYYLGKVRTYSPRDDSNGPEHLVRDDVQYLNDMRIRYGIEMWEINDISYPAEQSHHQYPALIEYRLSIPADVFPFVRLYLLLGSEEEPDAIMRLHDFRSNELLAEILFPRNNDIAAEVEIHVRKLGEEFPGDIQGKKEKGFAVMEKLGLRYPPGIVLSEQLVQKIHEATPEEKELYRFYIIEKLEKTTGHGNGRFSVRSNPKHSMPGILETVTDTGAASLMDAIETVYNSWGLQKARDYRSRKGERRTYDMPIIIQEWIETRVQGRENGLYAAGAFFTRSPETGKRGIAGAYLEGASGDALMTGGKQGTDIRELNRKYPAVMSQLEQAAEKLEAVVGPQEIEIATENGIVNFLQIRDIHFTPQGEINYLKEQVADGALTEPKALVRIIDIQQRLGKRQLYKVKAGMPSAPAPLTRGTAATRGAIQGAIAWNPDTVRRLIKENRPVVLLSRPETRQEMLSLLFTSQKSGLITTFGESIAHEMALARDAGVPVLNNVSGIRIDGKNASFPNGRTLREGDEVVLDADNNALFIPEGNVLEPDRVVEDISYGIDIAEFQKAFLSPFLLPGGTVHPKFTKNFLERMHTAVFERYKQLAAKGEKREAFIANLKARFLHMLVDTVPEDSGGKSGKGRDAIDEASFFKQIVGAEEKTMEKPEYESDREFISLRRAVERINPGYDETALRKAYIEHRGEIRSWVYGDSKKITDRYLGSEEYSERIANPRLQYEVVLRDLPYLKELRNRYGIEAWEIEHVSENRAWDSSEVRVHKSRRLFAPEKSFAFIRLLTLLGSENTAKIIHPNSKYTASEISARGSGESASDPVFDSISRTAQEINPKYDRAALRAAYEKFKTQLEDSVPENGAERVNWYLGHRSSSVKADRWQETETTRQKVYRDLPYLKDLRIKYRIDMWQIDEITEGATYDNVSGHHYNPETTVSWLSIPADIVPFVRLYLLLGIEEEPDLLMRLYRLVGNDRMTTILFPPEDGEDGILSKKTKIPDGVGRHGLIKGNKKRIQQPGKNTGQETKDIVFGLDKIKSSLRDADVQPGSVLYLNLDNVLIRTDGVATSDFIAERYAMLKNATQHNRATPERQRNVGEMENWPETEEWQAIESIDGFIEMENKEIARHLVHVTAGARELLMAAREKQMRVVIVTNRPRKAKANTGALLKGAGLDVDEKDILYTGPGGKEANAVVKDMNTRAPAAAYVVDIDGDGMEALQRAMRLQKTPVRLFRFKSPVQKPAAERARELLKEAAAKKTADTGEWETLLLKIILAVSQVNDGRGNPDKDTQLALLTTVLDIIEKNGLDNPGFVLQTQVYQYLYDLISYLIDVQAVLKAPKGRVPDSLKLYFRIVFPFNHETASRFYENGDLSLSEPAWEGFSTYGHGLESILSVDEKNMYVFLEPILLGILADPPDMIILPDTGTRPFAGIISSFIEKKDLATKIVSLPASFRETGDTENEILGRLALGKLYFENRGDLSALQRYLEENDLFPDLQKDGQKLAEVAQYYSSFFPVTASSKILFLDDMIWTGGTYAKVKKIFTADSIGARPENIRAAAMYLMRLAGKEGLAHVAALPLTHVSWRQLPPKIMLFPVSETDYDLRGAFREGKGHLVRETTPGSLERVKADAFKAAALKNFWDAYDKFNPKLKTGQGNRPSVYGYKQEGNAGKDSIDFFGATMNALFKSVRAWIGFGKIERYGKEGTVVHVAGFEAFVAAGSRYGRDSLYSHVWVTDLPRTMSEAEKKKLRPVGFNVTIGHQKIYTWAGTSNGTMVFYMDLANAWIPLREYGTVLSLGAAQITAQLSGTDNVEASEDEQELVREIARAGHIGHAGRINFTPRMIVDHANNGAKVKRDFSGMGIHRIPFIAAEELEKFSGDLNAVIRRRVIRRAALNAAMAENKVLKLDIEDLSEFQEAVDVFNAARNGQMLVDWKIFQNALDNKNLTKAKRQELLEEIQDLLKESGKNGVMIHVAYKADAGTKISTIQGLRDFGFKQVSLDLSAMEGKEAGLLLDGLKDFPLLSVTMPGNLPSPAPVIPLQLNEIVKGRKFPIEAVLDIRVPASLKKEDIADYLQALPLENTIIFHSDDSQKLISTRDMLDKKAFASLFALLVNFGTPSVTTPATARRLGYNWPVADLPAVKEGDAGKQQLQWIIDGELEKAGITVDSAIAEQLLELTEPSLKQAFLRAIAEKALIRDRMFKEDSTIAEAYMRGTYRFSDPLAEEMLGVALLQEYQAAAVMDRMQEEKRVEALRTRISDEHLPSALLELHRGIKAGKPEPGAVTFVIDTVLQDLISDYNMRKDSGRKIGTVDPRTVSRILSAA